MQREIRSLITQHQLSFIGLVETRVRDNNLPLVRRSTFPQFRNVFSNSSHCIVSTRIWVGWSPDIKVEIVSSSDQHVHCRTSNGSVVMMITIYYGCNSASDRKRLWDSLLHCSNNVNLPWIVLGDFNIIRWSYEKRGGAVSNYVDMKCFNDCIDSCGLDDFALKGPIFTWSNSSSESSRVECRLDRCLKNTAFNLVTVDYQGLVLNNSLFDHCPILISTSAVMKARSPFRFFNY